MANSNNGVMISGLLAAGESALTQLTSRLLNNEAFIKGMQEAVASALESKGRWDRRMQFALSQFNITTAEDLRRVRDKLDDLEEAVDALAEKVDLLSRRLMDVQPAGGKADAGEAVRLSEKAERMAVAAEQKAEELLITVDELSRRVRALEKEVREPPVAGG
ncbi:MAG: hypothetical protein GMKNLPBB_01471 [Myxococcota bacterium]|nr:hypothetical protein [Myxococcota bacterium]